MTAGPAGARRLEPAPLIGESPPIRRARELIARYATTKLPVLIVGATGTGKELVAQHIHFHSGRGGPLIDVDCGALPGTLLEATLFGHAPGAFTGAGPARPGLIEAAAGGTLFLDELGSLTVDAQRALLRVLDTRQVRRVGETSQRLVDFRLVSAVQVHIGYQLTDGSFRRDLYQRLAGIVVELPPLVERLPDVIAIADHYVIKQGRMLEPAAGRVLTAYDWPGNVRELCQVLDRAAQLVGNGTLPPAALTQAIALGALTSNTSQQETRATPAVAEIAAAGAAERWHGARVAAALGIHRATLFRRLKVLGLTLRKLRESQSH